MDNMTAKVSCFARAYHFKNNEEWIFRDDKAEALLGNSDYAAIAENMTKGISFFAPGFEGTAEEALGYIVNHQLAPSVLGRSAFCEKHLKNEIQLGCQQYVLFAAGFDTYAYRERQKGLTVFELDLPEMLEDKTRRAEAAGLVWQNKTVPVPCNLTEEDWADKLLAGGFQSEKKAFGSLLGISYYLSKEAFRRLILKIAKLWTQGSVICLDYPLINGGEASERNRQLASAANEPMQAQYSYEEMEALLAEAGFLIYEHVQEVKGVGYLLANKYLG